MKKIIAILLSVLMLAVFAACNNEKTDDNTETQSETESAAESSTKYGENIVNPISEVGSLEELNTILEAKITKPGVMGVTDEKFYTINSNKYTIGEYDFTVNGRECWIRFCPTTTEDISGAYYNGSTVFENIEGEGTVNADDASYSRWFTIDGQYILCVKGEDIEAEWFAAIADEIKASTSPVEIPDYAKFAGSYQDSVSQRATAEIEAKEDCIAITVSWADSADKTNIWTMNAKLTEDGLLNYNDCKYTIVEGETTETVYENGEGFFAPQEDGTLLWSGAADEMCKGCTFAAVEA